ncbi:MAG TPA: putative photosynthetic complex assembly protein PuhE [Steroidobacteraceae bacterium]|nr:putative photosynthetic complex assembly protein PuhE [Steroidobacteraceae bacterium]
MSSMLSPLLYTAAVWWTTTGLILFLNRLPPRTFLPSLAVASAVMAAALATLHATAQTATVSAIYEGFTATIAVWGWLEMSFLMGFLTGPQRHACPSGCAGLPHLGHAISAILYHEVAILAVAGCVFALTGTGANRVGWETFLVLWAMRQSAKLNLFLGVPNLGEAYLPRHIRYLASMFRRRPMNLLFPLSVTLGTLACATFVRAAATDTTAAAATADTILATLTGLGLLEHWFLVLPLRTEKLWQWSLRRDAAPLPIPSAPAPSLVRQSWDDVA